MNTETQQTAVAIIGAGVSGLIAARDLQRQGIEVLVLRPRTGSAGERWPKRPR